MVVEYEILLTLNLDQPNNVMGVINSKKKIDCFLKIVPTFFIN